MKVKCNTNGRHVWWRKRGVKLAELELASFEPHHVFRSRRSHGGRGARWRRFIIAKGHCSENDIRCKSNRLCFAECRADNPCQSCYRRTLPVLRKLEIWLSNVALVCYFVIWILDSQWHFDRIYPFDFFGCEWNLWAGVEEDYRSRAYNRSSQGMLLSALTHFPHIRQAIGIWTIYYRGWRGVERSQAGY